MTLAVFQRAAQRILAKLGEDSSLAGVTIGKVNLERDVVLDPGIVDMSVDNPVIRVHVATIPRSAAPRTGQTLVHPDGTFKLDRLLDDTGYNVRYIVVPA